MPIVLPEDAPKVSTPVVKRQKIGEKFVGAVVRVETRDSKRKADDGTMVTDTWSDGNPKKEIVVHCLAMPNTTAEAGIGDTSGVPEPGDEVRLIIKGGAYKEWKALRKEHRGGHIWCGDVIVQKMEYAQAYGADKRPSGAKLTDQAEVNNLPRSTVVGIYGPLSLHEPKDREWIDRAEEAHKRWESGNAIAADTPAGDDDSTLELF